MILSVSRFCTPVLDPITKRPFFRNCPAVTLAVNTQSSNPLTIPVLEVCAVESSELLTEVNDIVSGVVSIALVVTLNHVDRFQ